MQIMHYFMLVYPIKSLLITLVFVFAVHKAAIFYSTVSLHVPQGQDKTLSNV